MRRPWSDTNITTTDVGKQQNTGPTQIHKHRGTLGVKSLYLIHHGLYKIHQKFTLKLFILEASDWRMRISTALKSLIKIYWCFLKVWFWERYNVGLRTWISTLKCQFRRSSSNRLDFEEMARDQVNPLTWSQSSYLGETVSLKE